MIKFVGNLIIFVILFVTLCAFGIFAFVIKHSLNYPESIARSAFFDDHQPGKAASLVKAFDEKYSLEELRIMRPLVEDQLGYRPWIQIGNSDHSNQYSVVENGVRKTTSNKNCSEVSAHYVTTEHHKPIIVWFFGGSTMYGVGVPWWDTIPSKFVESANSIGICVSAINYGVPYHFSRQEVINFSSHLMNDQSPDIAIFLDGLNDFGQLGSTLRSEPYFTPLLLDLIPGSNNPADRIYKTNSVNNQSIQNLLNLIPTRFSEILSKLSIINPSSLNNHQRYNNRSLPDIYKNKSVDIVAEMVVKKYEKTSNFLNSICEANKIICIQFLQPVAAIDYKPNSDEFLTKDFIANKDRVELYNKGYEKIRSLVRNYNLNRNSKQFGLSFYDISSIFEDYDGIPYVDSGHYAPRAISLISKAMISKIWRDEIIRKNDVPISESK